MTTAKDSRRLARGVLFARVNANQEVAMSVMYQLPNARALRRLALGSLVAIAAGGAWYGIVASRLSTVSWDAIL